MSLILKGAGLGLALFAFGCTAQPSVEGVGQIERLGRYVDTDAGVRMAWPGSGLRYRYLGEGTYVSITDDGRGFMDVIINGEHDVIDLMPGEHEYALVLPGDRREYDIQLTRRSEFYDTGSFTLSDPKFTFSGKGTLEILPVLNAEREILFLGDSITAGFGVAGNTRDCANSPALHSPTESYAMLTAKAFDAEAHLIAISGRGVVHNWDANPAPVMPAQIDFALPDQPDAVWDHTDFDPKIIVVLLGTNDWSVIDPGRDKFRTGYLNMLVNLRDRHPAAHIVAVGGPLLGGAKGEAIRDGRDWALAQMGDTNIAALDVKLAERGLVWSCSSHPGRTSMRLIANDLMAHIATQTGWSYAPLNPSPIPVAPDYYPEDGKTHFAKRVAEISALEPLEGGTVMIGDSITEGWNWAAAQRDVLPKNINNHGVGWDTTTGVVARLPQILLNQPDRIFIMIGTNDISQGRSLPDMQTDFDTVLSALRGANPNADIYLQPVLPREADKLVHIAKVNAMQKRVGAAYGVKHIDMAQDFAAKDGTLKSEYTDDGLHLNAAGYAVWASHIVPLLTPN